MAANIPVNKEGDSQREIRRWGVLGYHRSIRYTIASLRRGFTDSLSPDIPKSVPRKQDIKTHGDAD